MPKSRNRFRLKFQTKVFIPVALLLVLISGITLYVVSREMERQMQAEASRALDTAEVVFRRSFDLRLKALIPQFRNSVSEPRFRAVANLRDEGTMTEALREMREEFGQHTFAIVYQGESGEWGGGSVRVEHDSWAAWHESVTQLQRNWLPMEIAFIRDTQAGWHSGRKLVAERVRGLRLLNAHREFLNRVSIREPIAGISLEAGRVLESVAVPVLAANRIDQLGVLLVLQEFDPEALAEMKSLTHTDIAILASGRVAGATLPVEKLIAALRRSALRGDDPSLIAEEVALTVDGEHFLAQGGNYMPESSASGFRYLLLSSYQRQLNDLRSTQRALVVISGAALLVAFVMLGLSVRRIVAPLKALRDGAESVGQGNYQLRVAVTSTDECGDLAISFNHMIERIQASRVDLEQTVMALRSTDAELRQSKEELRLIIESARDHMIVAFDETGRLLSWNPAASRTLGYGESEAQRLEFGALFDDASRRGGLPEAVVATVMSEGRHAFEGWRVRKDGTRFWADVTVSRLSERAFGGRAGFVEIARDITSRKEAAEAMKRAKEAAEASDRAKSEFLANMSHELRTPMNAIIGMADLLQGRLDGNAEDSDCLKTLRSSAGSLLAIIDDLLDLTRAENGDITLSPHPFDLISSLETVVDRALTPCREKGLTLDLFATARVPTVVVADEKRLQQIAAVLVSNAIKFTPSGGVAVWLDWSEKDEICIRVKDTGVGISDDKKERLFEAFTQGESSASRKYGGLGLGLAIADHLVCLMRGRIDVQSTVGVGTEFSVHVPVPRPVEPINQFEGLRAVKLGSSAGEDFASQEWHRQLRAWGINPVPWNAEATLTRVDLQSFSGDEKRPASGLVTIARPHKPREAFHRIKAGLLSVDAQRMPPASPAPVPSIEPLKVLLVEDNPINSKVATLALKRLGQEATWAKNGVEGLERMLAEVYDIVLMDLQMPEMDGLEATRRYREKIPFSQGPLICALTANALPEDRKACRDVGMHDFMAKPIQLTALTAVLEQAARRKAAAKAAAS